MMFADLVDLEDLKKQLSELGFELGPDASSEQMTEAGYRWMSAATSEQRRQATAALKQFQQASEGLILPAAKELLETLIRELDQQ